MTEFELSRVNRKQTQLETWTMSRSRLNSERGEKLEPALESCGAEFAGNEGSQGQACGRRAGPELSTVDPCWKPPWQEASPDSLSQSPGHTLGSSLLAAQFPLMGKFSLLL